MWTSDWTYRAGVSGGNDITRTTNATIPGPIWYIFFFLFFFTARILEALTVEWRFQSGIYKRRFHEASTGAKGEILLHLQLLAFLLSTIASITLLSSLRFGKVHMYSSASGFCPCSFLAGSRFSTMIPTTIVCHLTCITTRVFVDVPLSSILLLQLVIRIYQVIV